MQGLRRQAKERSLLKLYGSGPRKLMMIVVELKEFSPAHEEQRSVMRHMPFPLMIDDGV